MIKQRIYVSHPIAGQEDQGRRVAEEVEQSVELCGGIAVMPLDIPPLSHLGPCPPSYTPQTDNQHSAACYLKADLIEMLMCDGVVMATGWQSSVGCRGEMMTGMLAGLPFYFYQPFTGRIMNFTGSMLANNAFAEGGRG